jgi:hypothetical protein
MGNKVFIITRRFNSLKGIGIESENSDDYAKYLICDKFIEFWTRLFVDNKKNKDNLPQKNISALYKYFKANDTELKLCKIFNCLEYIDNNESEHLAKIYEYKPNGQSSDIFVYRHWLNDSSQGFTTGRLEFLSNLKKNVIEILRRDKRYDEEDRPSFNWLLHDKDVFQTGNKPSSPFCLDKKVYNPSLLSTRDAEEIKKQNLHADLHEDNIWLFTHEENDSYFKNIILNPDNKLWTADSLYDYLVIDKKGCNRRIKENGWNDLDTLTTGMLKKILEKESPYPEFSIKDLEHKTIGELKSRLNRWQQ